MERALGVPYPFWSPAALLRLARAVRSASVVHLHDCLYLPVLVAFAAARFGRRRAVVVTQHIGHVPYRNPMLRAAHAAANRLLGAWVLGGADQVVFESESVRAYFTQRVRFRSPPLLIENGVDTEVFRPCSAAERLERRAKLGIPPGKPVMLFIGRFVEKKGLAVLRELTGRVSQAHWLFAGWGPMDPAAWGRPNLSVLRQPRPRRAGPALSSRRPARAAERGRGISALGAGGHGLWHTGARRRGHRRRLSCSG